VYGGIVVRFNALKPYEAVRFAPPQSLPGRGRTLTLPGYRQTRSYSCGFASALMVLHYFERDLAPPELFRRLGTSRDGTRQGAIVRELRNAQVRANVRYDIDFARLVSAIDRDKPIIGYLHDQEHWLVIYGYGVDPHRVFVADPRPRHRSEHLWDGYAPRLNRFGIICAVRGMQPLTESDDKAALVQAPPAVAPRSAQLSFDFFGSDARPGGS